MAGKIRNILFIMFDQLRFDYLGCAGHPHLQTPHIDALAARGVRFSRAYVQSTICGASRMSFYTGRYVSSHGAAWNNFPLKVGEITLGDHLRRHGMRSWLIGKTHMRADDEGMERLGIPRDSIIGARLSECGFDVHTRDDGLWAQGPAGFYDERRSPYNEHLKAKGYTDPNPWANNANAGVDDKGDIASGWLLKNSRLAANVSEEDSETPWLTSRAIDFLQGDEAREPWLCHLSYIKPHWPYIVPAPYNALYDRGHVLPAVRDERERTDPHPVYAAFMEGQVGRAFQRDEVREEVIPGLYGTDQAVRRPDRPADGASGGERPDGGHDDRADLGSWRLSRRPLAGREGAVPRPVGSHPADRLRSARGGKRDPGHGERRTGGIDRSCADFPRRDRRAGARPHSGRPIPRAAAAWQAGGRMARVRDQRVRLLRDVDSSRAGPLAARFEIVHGRHRALETGARRGRLPADALRSGRRPGGTRRSRRAPGPWRGDRHDVSPPVRLGAPQFAEDNGFGRAHTGNARGWAGDKGILLGVYGEDEIEPEFLASYRGRATKPAGD